MGSRKILLVVFCLFLLPFVALGAGVIEAVPVQDSELLAAANKAANKTANKTATETAALADLKGFRLPDNYNFILVTLGAGGIAGWAVGFTLKKVAKVLALILGVVFISLQFLAFKQLITIDWLKIEGLYANNAELESSLSGFMSVITYNLPFASSFLLGFWLGFRKG